MKKLFATAFLALFAAGFASAQEQSKAPNRHYINFAFAFQEVNFETFTDKAGLRDHKMDWAVAAEFGSTFFMHKKPIAGLLRIGLDFSYLDVQYGQIKPDGINYEQDSHFANIGMQVGPSLTITPIRAINLKGYVHYAPSFAAYAPGSWETVYGGYAGYITGGVQLSLSAFTFGIEMRSAKANFKEVRTDNKSVESGEIFGDKDKTELPSTRFIFGFRF